MTSTPMRDIFRRCAVAFRPGPDQSRRAPARLDLRASRCPARYSALAAAAAVAVVDVGSGLWASRHYLGAQFGPVELSRVVNRGFSFGLAAGHPALVMALGFLGVVAVWWWLARVRSVPELVAVAVLLGGVLANLGERIAIGAVIDWIRVWGYPATFNLADVCIRGGLVAAAVLRWRHGRRAAR